MSAALPRSKNVCERQAWPIQCRNDKLHNRAAAVASDPQERVHDIVLKRRTWQRLS